VGKAVGQADEAEALIAGVEDKIAQVCADHPEFTDATAVATMAWQVSISTVHKMCAVDC